MWGFSCNWDEGNEEAEEVGEGRGGGIGIGREICEVDWFMLRRRKTVWGRVDRVKVRKRIQGMCDFMLVNGVITPRRVAA